MAEKKERKATTAKTVRSGGSASSVSLGDIFFITLRHWPWLLISIAGCLAVAYVYLLCTPSTYSRSADILIKEEKKGNSVGADQFADMGFFRSKTNIQNEITNLKAKDLMEEVVRRLRLDVNYSRSGTFHDEVAYGTNLPVKVDVIGYPDEESYSMTVKTDEAGGYTIEDLKSSAKGEVSTTYTGKLNTAVNTPLGKILVTPGAGYVKGQADKLTVKKIPVSQARGSYNGRLGVSMDNEEGSVLHITMSDQSPQRADDVLNTVIGVYNENWIRDKNRIAVSTSNFINDRLGVIEGELGSVDSDISSYKSANLVPDVEAAASMYMSQSQQTQDRILEVNNQLSLARHIKSYLSAEGNRELLPVNSGLQNSNIQILVGDYNAKVLKRNSLVATSSEKNPLVAQLDEQLNAQRQAIMRTVDNEIVALTTQLNALRGSEAQTISQIASNPKQAKNLLSTERQQKVKESLYLFLLQKREENELSQSFTAWNTTVVNKPGASGIPSSPNRSKILAYAFLLGLAIPFGYTYVKEISNTKVRGRKDVENLVVPFLGEIPQYNPDKKNGTAEKTILVKDGKRDIINEAFRVLRTNVEFMCNPGEGCRIIPLTSFNPGSGKSFISVNLGMSLALKERRVLVIDGDMRHGTASKYVDSPETGLSDYLGGRVADIDKILVKYDESDNFYILPVGSIPPNPTELLESPRLAKLLEELKSEFDYIIIDCPPIEVVADVQIIDRFADRTFFVIRAGLFERSMLPELDRLYEEKKYHNMAFILNGTNSDSDRYGYRYRYRYGYGYGYGYGYNYGDAKR